MSIKTGLWIDHRLAIIVRHFDYGEDVIRIASNLPKRVRFSGASHDSSEVNQHDDYAEDKRDRRYEELLKRYYDNVILHLFNAESILIFGPGEAKLELQKRLAKYELASSVVAVEAVDKMTERQIVAKVRQYFQEIEQPSSSMR
jgi:hypothetical protein